RCVNGYVEVALSCEPSFDYARADASWAYAGQGYESATARGREGDTPLLLATNLRLGLEGRTAQAYTRLREGDTAFAALSWGEVGPPASSEEAADRMWRAGDYWRTWLHHGEFPDHPWNI